jgi:tRNA (cytidine56-2'-O)-methyltransferase
MEVCFNLGNKTYTIYVLRLGHRIERDRRITTHVGLVSRAFGANGIYIAGEKDENVKKSLEKVVMTWGGSFHVEIGVSARKIIEEWRAKGGEIIHLTMYGLPLPNVIEKIRKSKKDKLIVVGAEKVPAWIFELADWNVSITNQPHSEVAALAVFLHELWKGKEFKFEFKNAKIRIVPSAKGKKVLKT